MLVIRGTQKLLDRARTSVSGSEPATTTLGDWYATVMSWRPQVALFVNEATRLPVLVPLAPGKKSGRSVRRRTRNRIRAELLFPGTLLTSTGE